jgi:DNA (cytosine-5)-methyltransferase 3A
LFDGISCGRVASERSELKIDKYYASEINEASIKITQKNYPDTIQLGNVMDLSEEKINKLDKIDLLMGGSPCEDLSIVKSKIRTGLDGDKSKLFWEYIRIKNTINPKYFLLENVASMSDESKNIITEQIGIKPIMINSNLVSGQDRERYYWTNIPNITQPEDKGIILKDIMETNVDEKYFYKQDFDFYGWDKKLIARLHLNCHDMGKRVYNPNFKSPTLTAINGGYHEKKVFDNDRCRKMTPLEYERLQTLPEGYTEGISYAKRCSMIGNGWTVDVIAHILKNIA